MLEFVKGYLSADGFAHGHLTKKECKEKIPLLLQWDQRWGYVSYGSSDIALSGCAPTCLSMVIVGLTGNLKATPNKIAKYAQDNGYYLKGTGTSWSLLTEGASHFGVVGREISLSKETVCGVLKQGQPVICSVGRGDFTTEGHFIVLTGMKDGRIKVKIQIVYAEVVYGSRDIGTADKKFMGVSWMKDICRSYLLVVQWPQISKRKRE